MIQASLQSVSPSSVLNPLLGFVSKAGRCVGAGGGGDPWGQGGRESKGRMIRGQLTHLRHCDCCSSIFGSWPPARQQNPPPPHNTSTFSASIASTLESAHDRLMTMSDLEIAQDREDAIVGTEGEAAAAPTAAQQGADVRQDAHDGGER